jgi:hypothetical protein
MALSLSFVSALFKASVNGTAAIRSTAIASALLSAGVDVFGPRDKLGLIIGLIIVCNVQLEALGV